ncbi:hypothetical protein ACEPAG_2690 [Sanghuangporus baumii]
MMIERVSRITRPEATTKGKTGARATAHQPVVCNVADQEGVPTRIPFKHIKSGIEINEAFRTANVPDNNATKVVAHGVAREATASHEWEEGRRHNSPSTVQARFKTERASVIINYRLKPLLANERTCSEGINKRDRVGNEPENKGCRTQRSGIAINDKEPEDVVLLDLRKRRTPIQPQRPNNRRREPEDKKLNAVCRAEDADTKTRRKGKTIWPAVSKNASTGSKRHRDESCGDINNDELLATDSAPCRRVRQKSDVTSKRKSYDAGKQTPATTAHRATNERRGPVISRDGPTSAEARRIHVGDSEYVASILMDMRRSTRLAHGTEQTPSSQPPSFVPEIMTGSTTRPRALSLRPRVKDRSGTKPTMEQSSIEASSCDALDIDSMDFVRIGAGEMHC